MAQRTNGVGEGSLLLRRFFRWLPSVTPIFAVWCGLKTPLQLKLELSSRREGCRLPAVAEAREDEHLCFAACGTKQQRLLPAVLI